MNKLVFFNKWLTLLNIFCIDIVFGFEKERKSSKFSAAFGFLFTQQALVKVTKKED